MDWDKVRIFKIVAESGSFTHAGEVLNLSQSAVSRQISALEESLGHPLFHRHARGLVLTEQGEILFESAREVFDTFKDTQTRLSDSRLLPEGLLTITTVDFIASSWLAPKLPGFKTLYPDIQMTLFLDDRVYDLLRREADVGIRLQKTEQADVIEKKLTTLRFSLWVSKSYQKTYGLPDHLQDLKNHMMIGHPPGTETPFARPNWIFNAANINTENNPKVVMMNSMSARYSAVKQGVGIAVLPDYVSRDKTDLVQLFPDLNIPGVDMFFVYPQERKHSKRISVFRDYLFDTLKGEKTF
ncbi:MAG: LysR family transcriptional regulator [Alphaproteobacteria bacterium]|nr:LysR family transcriptional regulator [Alphaproteobacteria bacterium]MBP7758955.1 LysR family transcriptional regulator [Alphaproteobacteria bacterium]MBP7762230.1 LysR family transcriptional regulator [Alphaproteobacteria bacterium]MBP7904193.1 LysR family transcriptional regulator [Alphaproteobacteria bacterium]